MDHRDLLLLPLLCVSLGACAADLPEDFSDDDRKDDLVGEKVTVYTHDRLESIAEPGQRHTVRPRVLDFDIIKQEVVIVTDRLYRVRLEEPLRAMVDTNGSNDDGQYVILLRYTGFDIGKDNTEGTGEWFWHDVQVTPVLEPHPAFGEVVTGYDVSGTIARTEDSWGGLSSTTEVQPHSVHVEIDKDNFTDSFSFLVVPTWDRGNWDEDGYVTTISFQ